jgi:hypothetical protein
MIGPIARGLADAFREAVEDFLIWRPSDPEPEININGQGCSLTTVCRLVGSFGDDLPEPVFEWLSYYMDSSSNDLREKLTADRTYRTGAYCLRELIKRRKEGSRQAPFPFVRH